MDTWRSEDTDVDSDMIEIIPVDEYDTQKAKTKASLSWILSMAYQDKVPAEFHDPFYKLLNHYLTAKTKASLAWILSKAYQDKVPAEFQDPFYETGEGHWQIKPRLANILANSDVYCQACRNMFGENASQWKGHWSIIQVLSRKGIYAGTSDVDVTETILMQSAPFKIKAHIALIDALMQAFASEIITVERVTQCVRRFASFNASSELPSDTEDAILFWINKVCVTVQKNLEKGKDTVIEGGETSQKVRIVSNKTPRDSISVPIMESLLTDMGDGCSLATLISFYCPQILKIDDVCLKSNVGIADSLYNLRLIKTFCHRHLPFKTCHFSFEDLLYTHQTIRQNLVMMIAEVYFWFEVKPLPIVTGGGVTHVSQNIGDGDRPHTASKLQSSSKIPDVPISQVTKQSFQRVKGDSELRSSSTQDLHKMSPSAPLPHRVPPLLHKRQQHSQDEQNLRGLRSSSTHDLHKMSPSAPLPHRVAPLLHKRQQHSQDEQNLRDSHIDHSQLPPTQSTVAWPDLSQKHVSFQQQQQQQQQTLNSDRSGLLSNVSIDSDMNASFSSGSIDLGELDPTPRLDTDRSEFDQVSNNEESPPNLGKQVKRKTPFPGNNKTPFPAISGKESVQSYMESGESRNNNNSDVNDSDVKHNESELSTQRSGQLDQLEPLLPARLKPAKEKTNNHSKEEERDEIPKRKTPSPPKLKSKTDNLNDLGKSNFGVSEPSALHNESADQVFHLHRDPASDLQQEKRFDAFFIRGSVDESQEILTHRSDVTVAESYVIDKSKTPEAARAAGIPIIEDSALSPRRLSREGSVASSKSSGDFSDHESHKIHSDHKTRETQFDNNIKNKLQSNNVQNINNVHNIGVSSPGDFIIQKPVMVTRKPNEKPPKGLSTNFAQIRQMKQHGNVDNSGFVYMQHGHEGEGQGHTGSLKDAFQRKKAEKKTSFAPLPNQTTWGQSSSGGSTNHDEADGATANENGSASQELLKIRMKLEEKRKAIERKKHTQEIQQQKIRQRLGKAAFLHVVSKTKDDDSVPTSSGTSESAPPARMTTSDPEIPVLSPRRVNEPRDQNSIHLDKSAYAKQNRPFSRDDIQQTIENVRKKWFNGEELMAPKVMDDSDHESPEMSRSQSSNHSNHSDRPCTLDDLQTFEARSQNDEVARRPVVFDRRSASIERITSLADNDMNVGTSARDSSPNDSVRNKRSASRDRNDIQQQQQLQQQQQPVIPAHANKVEPSRADVTADRRSSGESTREMRPEQSSSPRTADTSGKKPETYEEYNNSLDKLNQSLSDLQGEIMKLSLKQRKPDKVTRSRSGSRSPPHDLDIGSKTLPARSRSKQGQVIPEGQEDERVRNAQQQQQQQPTHSQNRSASEPRQIQSEGEGQTSQTQIGQYQSSTLPRQPHSYTHNQHGGQVQHNQYMVQNPVPVAGPAGPVYGSPNQYIPMTGQAGLPPTAQQYGSYIMGPSPQPAMGQIPQQAVSSPYQGSPPHMYPVPATMYPGQPYHTQAIVSPQSQPFPNMYPSPPHTQYQHPVPLHHPAAGTYTTTVHNTQIPYTPLTQPYDPTTQQQQQQQQQHVYQQQQQHTQQPPFSNYADTQSVPKHSEQSIPSSSYNDRLVNVNSTQKQSVPQSNIKTEPTNENADGVSNIPPGNDKSGGFFVSMNEGSPRRVKSKPQLSDKKVKSELEHDKSGLDSSVIADFAQKIEQQQQHDSSGLQMESNQGEQLQDEDKHETSVGFVVGQDETSLDESTEEEMQKKKDKIEKMRLKRQEEQERKRMKIEQEMARKRELERQRQEESERRKSEEKARREQIFKQYLEKKEEEEDKPPKREKPKHKSRPKSMFVKAGNGPDLSEPGDGCSSTEDLSARAFTIPAGENNSNASGVIPRGKFSRPSTRQNMRKAVSCNQLPQNGSMSASADSKSLAFGGLTHRRPPSPDLYGRKRGNRSNESSDAGSAHGSDYSGPKLFVKPSAKSNRHIIINAISHCCLAGSVNTEHKNKVLEEVAKSNAKHFIILFRDTSCGYRGLYGFDPDTEDCLKICGVGPRAITHDVVEKYYKYNSGGKSFSEVKSTKHISVSIDAVNLQNYVWKQGNKAPANENILGNEEIACHKQFLHFPQCFTKPLSRRE